MSSHADRRPRPPQLHVYVSVCRAVASFLFFFFIDRAPPEFYPLSLPAALPIFLLAQPLDRLDRRGPVLLVAQGKAAVVQGRPRVRRIGEAGEELVVEADRLVVAVGREGRAEIGRAHV